MKELGELYVKNQRKYINKVARIIRDREEAEDVVQAAYIRALENQGSFDPSRATVATWFGMLLNTTMWRHLRDKRGQPEVAEFTEDTSPSQPDPEALEVAWEAELSHVDNPLHKVVIHARLSLGYSPEEIESVFGVNPENTKKIVTRFRNKRKVV